MYEAVTKIIMDMENCSYEMTTGIGLGIDVPTKTPYGMECYTLIQEKKQRRELTLTKLLPIQQCYIAGVKLNLSHAERGGNSRRLHAGNLLIDQWLLHESCGSTGLSV